MGTLRNGGNGTFIGKAGSFIGSTWRDISYMKGIPKISNKPKSLKQLEQQSKFATAIRFLGPIKDLLNVGFNGQKQRKASGYNMAVKFILDNAITGTYPDYTIDYGKVMVAKGTLAAPVGPAITAYAETLVISWSPDINPYNGFLDDEATAVIFDPLNNIFLSGEMGILRPEGEMTVYVPAAYLGNTVHVYLFFMARNGRVSNSSYAGSAVIV
ncbi:DUF6266 family protein [Daejeonella sp.]|uniref:DUF6266 family protein n=1 Tax=Daejeonella sp. TaxID=2805397 RepID=UPI0030C289E3